MSQQNRPGNWLVMRWIARKSTTPEPVNVGPMFATLTRTPSLMEDSVASATNAHGEVLRTHHYTPNKWHTLIAPPKTSPLANNWFMAANTRWEKRFPAGRLPPSPFPI